MEKPELQALPTIRDRMSFLYVEHSKINRQDGAVTITDARGTVHAPAASLTVLMLGPGTEVSHRAMELLGDSGASVIWVGEHGVRYYAHGRTLTNSARLLIRQAELVTNVRSRAAVAKSSVPRVSRGDPRLEIEPHQIVGFDAPTNRRSASSVSQMTRTMQRNIALTDRAAILMWFITGSTSETHAIRVTRSPSRA
ncbi:MAG: CRISPR-associated endonuclease Cas1 [Oscillospiraceae bacterium]|nr:CRISPR-associated endonuclease Cas1 [Oscillospiraceae bacterium]